MVRDLVPAEDGFAELRRSGRASEVLTDREERERHLLFVGEGEQSIDGDVVHRGLAGGVLGRVRIEPVDRVVVRDLVEVDAEGGKAHGGQGFA